MRRAVLALNAIVVLIFLVDPIAQVTMVKANPSIGGPQISIQDPHPRIYPTTTIPVLIVVYSRENYPQLIDLSYSLDGTANRSLSISNSLSSSYFGAPSYLGTGTLKNLTNGNHSLEVYALNAQGKVLSLSITFLVNTTYRYPTLLVSPVNATYSKNDVPLTYTINGEGNYMVGYWLDDSERAFLDGNITLSGLSKGQHTITIKATSGSSGNSFYSEQTAYFTIKTANSEQPLATSNLTIAVVIVTIAIMTGSSLAVLAYKRRKKVSDSYD
jgi:hypothetical protein